MVMTAPWSLHDIGHSDQWPGHHRAAARALGTFADALPVCESTRNALTNRARPFNEYGQVDDE